MWRKLFSVAAACAVTLLLFWLMQAMIRPPDDIQAAKGDFQAVQISRAVKPPDELEDEPEPDIVDPAPPPPPAAPSFKLPGATTISLPQLATPTPNISLPAAADAGLDLGGAFGKDFGGFTGSSGAGLSGFGQGKGFKGSKLVPRATARPQIPKYAYERGIEGWVEVVFVVTKAGKVKNVRIVDAQPKGIFEAAMVESVSNWIYEASDYNREVQQRFEFKLEDFKYNW